MTFDAATTYDVLFPHFQERIRRHEPLARHSAFGVGGAADVWISLESRKELFDLVSLCSEKHWPLLIVGNGTNVLFADAGVRGIVARMALSTYSLEDEGDGTALLVADAGVSWPLLLHELAPRGWGGLEFGVGIPGTLGGAVISNAGAHNHELGQVLEWIEVLDARGCNTEDEHDIGIPLVRRYEHDELDLSYRHSRFREQRYIRFDEHGHYIFPTRSMIEPAEIVMQLGIRLHRAKPEQLQTTIAEHKRYRKQTEPPPHRAGTVFKDPAGHDVDTLITQAGMKGKIHGQAQISPHHTNYIVNLGGAQAVDIATLIMETRQRVLEKFGVALELDVEFRGEWEKY